MKPALYVLAAALLLFAVFHGGSWSGDHEFTASEARAHPERVLRWWFQRGDRDDPRLYFELSGQILGKPYDAALLEYKRGHVERMHATEIVVPAAPLRPYVEARCEYPPLALALFVGPRLLTDDPRVYSHLFSVEMALILGGIGLLVWRLRRRLAPGSPAFGRALDSARIFALAVLFWGITQVVRFDAAPALATGGALLAFVAGAPGWAGALLGVGAALKLWPALIGLLFLAGLLVDGNRRGALRMAAAGVAVAAAAHAPFVAMAGAHALDYLAYQGGRGLHTESLVGNALVLVSRFASLRVWTQFENGSDVVHAAGITERAVALPHVLVPVAVCAVLAAFVRCARRTAPSSSARAVGIIAAAVALVAAVLVTSNVFSPQYLVWLAPGALALPGRDGRAIAGCYLASCLLTQIFYPRAYSLISDLTLVGHLLLFARNVLLVVVGVLAGRLALRVAASRVAGSDGAALELHA